MKTIKFPARTSLEYNGYSITVISTEELSTWSTKRLLSFYASIRAKVSCYYERFWCCEFKCFHLFDESLDNYKKEQEYYEKLSSYQKDIKTILNTRENIIKK